MAIEKVFVRSAYNYDRDAASDASGLACVDESRAKQSFAEECDINTIVRRFGLSGELPTGVRMPTYADFTGIFDFHSAMNAIAQAGEAFDSMPAHVRARFDNDPAKFVDFCSQEENRAEAIKLGLVDPAKSAAEAASLASAAASSVAAPAAAGDGAPLVT